MQIGKEITIQTPNGLVVTRSEFNLILIDNEVMRTVKALLLPAHATLMLWEGEAYAAAGDYTQQQAQARVIEVLGDHPETILNAKGKPVPPQPGDNPPAPVVPPDENTPEPPPESPE